MKERKARTQRKRILTDGEVSALALAATGLCRDIIIFAASTGCRQSEILNLGWHQVRGDELVFEPHEHKAGNLAASWLNEEAARVLSRRPDGEYVFAVDGKPLPRRQFHTLWNTARQRSGVQDVKFHDLRRYLATSMLAAGASMEEVKAQLRHADVRTTQKAYAQDTLTGARAALAKLRGIDCA